MKRKTWSVASISNLAGGDRDRDRGQPDRPADLRPRRSDRKQHLHAVQGLAQYRGRPRRPSDRQGLFHQESAARPTTPTPATCATRWRTTAPTATANSSSSLSIPPTKPSSKQEASSYRIQPVQVNVMEKDNLQVKKAYMGMVLIYGDKHETHSLHSGRQQFRIRHDLGDQAPHLRQAAPRRLPRRLRHARPEPGSAPDRRPAFAPL